MSWSYVKPDDSPKDEVRYLIGDTSEVYALASDEEILYNLKKCDNNCTLAAIKCLDGIIAKISYESIDYKIGPEQVDASTRLENYKILRDQLQTDLRNTMAVPTMPVLSTESIFDIGMHDNR